MSENKTRQTQFKIALAQLKSASDHVQAPNIAARVQAQFNRIEQMIDKAQQAQIDCLVFPEECLTLDLTTTEKSQLREPYVTGALQTKWQQLARHYQIWIVAGTLPIHTDQGDKYTSSTLLLDPNGEIKARYDKIHLFDVEIEPGKEAYCESEHVLGGNRIVVYDLPWARVGLSVCYDIRFPELYRAMMQQGVEVFIIPSAFTYRTGKKHWEILLRARAVENLAYVAACNHAGTRHNGERTYGHSMVINPWGEIMQQCEENEAMIIATFDMTLLHNLRKQFPALSHTKKFILQALTK